MIQEGDSFPSFSLPDQNGNTLTLDDLKGSKIVIYFYPKDDTSGCTAEACEFNAALPTVSGARVVGVSPDKPKSHDKFAKKYGLNFTLLADEDHSLAEACGVWVEKSMYGKKYMGIERSTFLLDENGMVVRTWRKVSVPGHVTQVLASV